MSAVLGGDPAAVLATIGRHLLTPANVNGAGQVVAAGSLSALAELAADPPPAARVIPLKVAGAFHTHYMEPAVDALRAAATDHDVSDPGVTLVSNRDGAGRHRRPRGARPARRPGVQPGALGPVHGAVHRPSASRPSSSCHPPAP